MDKTDWFFWGNLSLTTIAGVLGFTLSDRGLWALVYIILGAVWFYGHQRNPGKTASTILVCIVISACLGLFMGVSSWWALLSVIAGLAAWDLDQFTGRVTEAGLYNQPMISTQLQKVEDGHLHRLGIVEGLALISGGCGLILHIRLGFGIVLILSLLGTIGLGQLIGTLRRESD